MNKETKIYLFDIDEKDFNRLLQTYGVTATIRYISNNYISGTIYYCGVFFNWDKTLDKMSLYTTNLDTCYIIANINGAIAKGVV